MRIEQGIEQGISREFECGSRECSFVICRLQNGFNAFRRRLIRNSLADWARYRELEPARHHQLIIDGITAFLASEDEVLLLFAPPGSAKSTYVSVLLPAWYLARHPSHSVLAATHSVEFAERWGRRVRNDIALASP